MSLILTNFAHLLNSLWPFFTTKQSITLLIVNSPTIHYLEKLKYIKGNKLQQKKYEFGIKTFWKFINVILCQLGTLWNGSRPGGIIPTSDFFLIISFNCKKPRNT